MFSKLRLSIRSINLRLYFALLVLGFAPTVYNTLRVFFLGQLPGEWAYSIAGQLSWVNLLYEILNEAIILPLFYFTCKVKEDKAAVSLRPDGWAAGALPAGGHLPGLLPALLRKARGERHRVFQHPGQCPAAGAFHPSSGPGGHPCLLR